MNIGAMLARRLPSSSELEVNGRWWWVVVNEQ
jgi:hypothetical protein